MKVKYVHVLLLLCDLYATEHLFKYIILMLVMLKKMEIQEGTQQKSYMITGNRRDRVSAFYTVNTLRTHCRSPYSHCISPYWEQYKKRTSRFTNVPTTDLRGVSTDLRSAYAEY